MKNKIAILAGLLAVSTLNASPFPILRGPPPNSRSPALPNPPLPIPQPATHVLTVEEWAKTHYANVVLAIRHEQVLAAVQHRPVDQEEIAALTAAQSRWEEVLGMDLFILQNPYTGPLDF